MRDHNEQELMERQWVQQLKRSQDEVARRHNDLCSNIGVVLNNHEEMLKDLQWKQHVMEENERNKFAPRVGAKMTESSPCPSPVDPVPVQPRSRSKTTRGRRIEAELPLFYFCPIGDFFVLRRPATPPIDKISATFG